MAATAQALAKSKEKRTTKSATSAVRNRLLVMTLRALWLVIALIDVTMFVISVPVRQGLLAHPPTVTEVGLAHANIRTSFYTTYNLSLEIIYALAFVSVSLLIVWRKSNEPTALLTSLMLMVAGTAGYPMMSTMHALSETDPTWIWPVRIMVTITWVIILLFFCIFPDGRFSPGWTKGLAVVAIGTSIPSTLFPDTMFNLWNWPAQMLVPLQLGILSGCIYAQVCKYRRATDPVQKQQTKWVLFGLSVAVVGVLGFLLPRYVFPNLQHYESASTQVYMLIAATVTCLAASQVPVTFGLSILRYRLWEIDLLINRTLVYVPLTGILAGVYTASIALFQRVFVALTGERSDAAIVLSTLILASLFTPVKNALQAAVDKRFKEVSDPIAELTAFNKHVQSVLDVIDAQQITRRLLDEAVYALGATGGAVYLGKNGHLQLLHKSDEWNGDVEISVPLKTDGTKVGMVVLGPRRNDIPYTPKDRETLEQVVNVVARALVLADQGA